MATANYNIRMVESASGIYFTVHRNSTTQPVDATSGAPNRVSATLDVGANGPPTVKTVTAASNATPIVLTCSPNTTGLADGDWVKVENVLGNTNANGLFILTATSSPNTTLLGSAGNAAFSTSPNARITKLPLAQGYQQALARAMEAVLNDRSTQ